MSAQTQSNVSADLIWEISRTNNAFLVKRAAAGGVRFSRDPLNVANLSSRKHAGYINDKAVGIQPSEKGGAVLITKRTKNQNRPAAHLSETPLSGERGGPKTYKSVASVVGKNSYRPDLLPAAVARTSRIRQTARPSKEFEQKERGVKARKE